jgi:hypothetical protein
MMLWLGIINIILGGINMYAAGDEHARHHSMAFALSFGILALLVGVLLLLSDD